MVVSQGSEKFVFDDKVWYKILSTLSVNRSGKKERCQKMARAVIVEDDRVTVKILEKALTEAGLEVLIAEDGMKGLDLIQTSRPEIAIIDMLIPKLHGVELCKRIRANNLLQDVKIILMSAVYKFSTFRADIEEAEADYFINKPLDVPRLLGFINQVIGPKGNRNV
jgi:DNA-binding response OmpR family regulator